MSKIFTTLKSKIRARNATLSELANLKTALPLGLTELDESYKQNGYGFVTKCGDGEASAHKLTRGIEFYWYEDSANSSFRVDSDSFAEEAEVLPVGLDGLGFSFTKG